MENKQALPEQESTNSSMKINEITKSLMRRIKELNPALHESRMLDESEMILYGPALERQSVKKQPQEKS